MIFTKNLVDQHMPDRTGTHYVNKDELKKSLLISQLLGYMLRYT